MFNPYEGLIFKSRHLDAFIRYVGNFRVLMKREMEN